MIHLSENVLARLVDAVPRDDEALHLESCIDCAGEVERLREQTEALRTLSRICPSPPAGEWERLRLRLRQEGLIEVGKAAAVPEASVVYGATGALSTLASSPSRWLRFAAGILLFLGGTGLGVLISERGSTGMGAPGGAHPLSIGEAGEFDPRPFAQLGVRTLEEAEELVRVTQEWHIEALLLYRGELESATGEMVSGDPIARYLYLDDLLLTAEAAIRESPADPFLNGLFASTVAEREVALREIAMAPAEAPRLNAR